MFQGARAVVAYNGSDAGLGNRMRVTLGGARYAAHLDAKFFYVWPTSSQFEPRPDELWEWSAGTRIPRILSRGAGKFTGFEGKDLRRVSPGRVVQIRTGGELLLPAEAGDWREDFRALTPVEEISEVVTLIHAEHLGTEPYIGIQIRVHSVSHQRTKDTSPLEWFTERMRKLSEAYPSARFFVSCDVPEIKRQILRAFPSASAHIVEAQYNSTAAVRASIVDLYLLAASSYMLGPTYSSFIELAQFLAAMKVPTDKPGQVSQLSGPWQNLGPARDALIPAVRR